MSTEISVFIRESWVTLRQRGGGWSDRPHLSLVEKEHTEDAGTRQPRYSHDSCVAHETYIAKHAAIRLPLPAAGFEQAGQIRQYMSDGAVVEHPRLGLGVVRSRLARISEAVLVHFEHEDKELRLTDPV